MEHKDLTHRIIGSAMKVHRYLGNGFQEVVYQRCLAIEFDKENIRYSREQEMPLFYYNKQVGTRRVDFIVDDLIMLELKALIKLEDVHLAQGINYLKAYNLETGLLINFGSPSMEFKRLFRK